MSRGSIATALALAVSAILASTAVCEAGPDVSDDSLQKAKAHYKQGAAYHDAGAYDQAIAEYQAAYQLAPLPELIFNIAQAYRLKHDDREALAQYRRFLELRADGPLADEARTQVALITKELGEPPSGTVHSADTGPARGVHAGDRPEASNPQAPAGRGLRITGIAAGVAGLAAIGIGVKFAVDARDASHQASLITQTAQESGTWSGGAASRLDAEIASGETAQRRMYISYGVGGALVVTGAVLYVLGVRAGNQVPEVAPIAGPHGAGLAVTGVF